MLLQPKGALNGISEGLFNHTLPSFLADPFWAMVMVVTMSVWQGLGYNMLIFSAVLEQLPDSVIEAARIDGATGARLFFHVTLPMISPANFIANARVFSAFARSSTPYYARNSTAHNFLERNS